jgi:hypothetical protein
MLFSSFNLPQSFNYAPYLFCKKWFKSEINCFYIRTQRICEYWYISEKTIQFINSHTWQLIRCTYDIYINLLRFPAGRISGSLHGSPPRFHPSKKVRKLSYFASVALHLASTPAVSVSDTIVGLLAVVGTVAGVPNVAGCRYKASLLLFTSVIFLLYMCYCWFCCYC